MSLRIELNLLTLIWLREASVSEDVLRAIELEIRLFVEAKLEQRDAHDSAA